ncbi:LysR substrate-binding domain-containing protein [Variovorax ginsengisoli]|uniref:DNA-binding transcriptional LysR family regulator n=1 Tax=Variovorax ginsengisoli TaxID=363844 RepID=A0ABT9S9Q8_9BURK|nr:LysR substrate-binding domain-containing protein [Variovorax ginsengisoli]MDP9901091.1 DNA-binding transcriptional LysR family regulator [Variovorax ginsengisoli]
MGVFLMQLTNFTPLGDPAFIELRHASHGVRRLRMRGRLSTDEAPTARASTLAGHGVVRLLRIDADPLIREGRLIPLLPRWTLPGMGCYAIAARRDDQPLKVVRCIESVRAYFGNTDA